MADTEWEELTDEQGNTYYYNSVTQETTWTKPGSNGDWLVYTTDDGREYYYNEKTQETTWEKPDGLVLNEDIKQDEEGSEETLNDLDRELQQKPIQPSPIQQKIAEVEPNSRDNFIQLLSDNSVDSTWSFQKVMSRFIKEPAYWAVEDSLERKKIYDEYLDSRLRNDISNKEAVVQKFKADFVALLESFRNANKINTNTRWISIKQKLIDEENPIFIHTVLSDAEISNIYYEFIDEIRRAEQEEVQKKKKQALDELESYLTKVNTNIVTSSKDWDQLYDRLQNDSRFQANKHFKDLDKLDILDLYMSKIFPITVQKLRDELQTVERANYRQDRKARSNFKQFLSLLKITATTLFKDMRPIFEENDAYIELCGRKGSLPLELFWDVVDEAYQAIKLRKDLVDGYFLDMRRHDPVTYDYDNLLQSLDHFTEAIRNSNDDRLSTIKPLPQEELQTVYAAIKKDHEKLRERLKKANQEKILVQAGILAKWLSDHYTQLDYIDVSDKENEAAIKISSKFSIVSADYEALKGHLSSVDEFKVLQKLCESSEDTQQSISVALEKAVTELIKLLQEKSLSKETTSRKREYADTHDLEPKRPKPTPKVNPVVINY